MSSPTPPIIIEDTPEFANPKEKVVPPVNGETGVNEVSVADIMGQNVTNPLMAKQSVYTPGKQTVAANELISSTEGQATSPVVGGAGISGVTTVAQPGAMTANTYTGSEGTAATTDAAQGTVSDTIDAQTGVSSKNTAATGKVEGQIDPMTGRVVDQTKELAQAATADRSFLGQYDPAQSAFQSDMQAATMEVTDEMTVQGQLTQLSSQFKDGKVPGWAAGIVRSANQQMAARGLSASSMAGAAVTQAALEAAIPIATRDAATYFETAKAVMNNKQQANLTNTQNNLQIEMANLSNRQQVGLAKMQVEASLTGQELSNQQQVNILNANKFSEAANMTFTQEQNRVFANSKMIETLNMQNLSNEQAMALSNAANMANMDMANLSNRQQAEVQNAQNLLQMDMANLSNEQQSKTINQAAQQQAMLSNQAAVNAASQFNATSENQVDQFFATLKTNIDSTNASSANASSQFNAGQVNAMNQFKANQKADIEKFNANNSLVIAQSNVQWRRNTNTANTGAQNAANQINAQNYFNLSNTALSNIWQEYRDEAAFVYQGSQNNLDRAFNYSMAVLEAETTQEMFDKKVATNNAQSIGNFLSTLIHAATSVPEKKKEGDA